MGRFGNRIVPWDAGFRRCSSAVGSGLSALLATACLSALAWSESPRDNASDPASAVGGSVAVGGSAAVVRFDRDVRPILSEHCWTCHGPDAGQRQADLRLDQRDSATADNGSGPAIVPGDPHASALFTRISSSDPEAIMPPPETRKPLTDEQIDILKRWLEQGAPYEGHWAYAPIHRPAIPQLPDPLPAAWPTDLARPPHPIDALIQSRLLEQGLRPAPTAAATTLIRRLYLDLHGLPPPPQAVTEFQRDHSPGAYRRLVDQLLASPRFAERMAIAWLDAVRYADTVGFHGDQEVSLWPYRDYVLRSFHENKPFDQFTREQLAGDLLPDATDEQRIASAFNRLNRMSTEGGVQDKEYLAKYAADRVRTVSMVWLGSTMGCCECHDHKYDPFTMRDFYSLASFFADVQEHGFYPSGFDRGDWGPRLELPTAEQAARQSELQSEIARLDQQIAAIADDPQSIKARESWIEELRRGAAGDSLKWRAQLPLAAASANGAVLTIQSDGLIVSGGPNPDRDTATIQLRPGPGVWTGLRIATETSEDLPGNRVGRGWRSFVVTDASLQVSDGHNAPQPVILSEAFANRDSPRFPAGASIDGDPHSGWAIEHGHSANHQLALRFAAPLATDDRSMVVVRIEQQSDHRQATLGRFRIGLTSHVPVSLEDGPSAALVEAALAAPESRTEEQSQLLRETYRQADPRTEPLRTQRAQRQTELRLLEGQIRQVLTTEAGPPRTMRMLPRGNWMDESGAEVQPDTPKHLPALGVDGRRATRLDLANWLVRDDQPLTARVTVNRLWYHFFGAGLTPALEDVGSQGQSPNHPELLDWLASEFQHPTFDAVGTHAWDLKHVVRQIVITHAYQQTSKADAELLAVDPQNRWLARQIPLRLDAESIRDTALANAGMLNLRFGGPSIRPPQPAGHWLPLNYPKREYDHSFGDEQYARSVYMHWQRTFLHPALSTFDASSREECQVARAPSNTPLQALVLLNDPIFVEAARGFAQRALREGPSDDAGRLDFLAHQALGRPWSETERNHLLKLLDRQRQTFADDPAAARALLSIGDLPLERDQPLPEIAAFTVVARAVLNLHETITRD